METLTLSGLGVIGAGLSMGFAAAGGGVGMGTLMSGAIGAMARQPEEAANSRLYMFIGLAFIEAQVLYGFVLAMLLMAR